MEAGSFCSTACGGGGGWKMDLQFSVKLYDKFHGNIRGQQGMWGGGGMSVEKQLLRSVCDTCELQTLGSVSC